MGWAYCGVDRYGREIGYGIEATCDQRGCEANIDRGLGYCCGRMHNGDEGGCGRYYCGDHLYGVGPRGGCPHRGKQAWGRTKCQLLRRRGRWPEDPDVYYCACHEWEHGGSLPPYDPRREDDPYLENYTLVPGFVDHIKARVFASHMRYPEMDNVVLTK